MSKVVNLNRFRKRKAKEEKERRAERNRRYHGRTQAERKQEEAARQRLEKQLDGAYLVRERVDVSALETQGLESDSLGRPSEQLQRLERATEQVVSLSEYAARALALSGTADQKPVPPSDARQGASWASASEVEFDCVLQLLLVVASVDEKGMPDRLELLGDRLFEQTDGRVDRARLRAWLEGVPRILREDNQWDADAIARLLEGLSDPARRGEAFRLAVEVAGAHQGGEPRERRLLLSLAEQLRLEPALVLEVMG